MDVDLVAQNEQPYSSVVLDKPAENLQLIDMERVLKFKKIKDKGQYFKSVTYNPVKKTNMYQFFGKCLNCGCEFIVTVDKENAGETVCECKQKYYIKESVIYGIKSEDNSPKQ